jgi:hypothetical protein
MALLLEFFVARGDAPSFLVPAVEVLVPCTRYYQAHVHQAPPSDAALAAVAEASWLVEDVHGVGW